MNSEVTSSELLMGYILGRVDSPDTPAEYLEGYDKCLGYATEFRGSILNLGVVSKERVRQRLNKLRRVMKYYSSQGKRNVTEYDIRFTEFFDQFEYVVNDDSIDYKIFFVSLIIYTNTLKDSSDGLIKVIALNMLELLSVAMLEHVGYKHRGNLDDLWHKAMAGFSKAKYRYYDKKLVSDLSEVENIDVMVLHNGEIELTLDGKETIQVSFRQMHEIHNFYMAAIPQITSINRLDHGKFASGI